MRSKCNWLMLAVLLLMVSAHADVRLSKMFTDNAVFQREMPIKIWGWAEAKEKVVVKLGDVAKAETTANAQGEWSVELPTQKMAENLTLTVSGKNTLTLNNLAIGEVWFCSGQSNMEWTLTQIKAASEIEAANFPQLRVLRVPKMNIAPKPQNDLPKNTEAWKICTPENAAKFSAVGFYFAKLLNAELNVPIGIVDTSWGGARIEPYIRAESISKIPDFDLAVHNKSIPDKEARQRGLVIYNAMVAPCIPYTVRGILWYQGCSNDMDKPADYAAKMDALVTGWREIWGRADLPFYAVQLANYNSRKVVDGFANVRLGQMAAMKKLPHCGLATAIDIGEGGDIHPKNKLDVAKRLLLWALHDVYGKKEIVVSGPWYKEMKIEGDKIRVSFDYVGGGLMVAKKAGQNPAVEIAGGKLTHFQIAGADKKFVPATATIDGENVVVNAPEITEPKFVRYAYSNNPAGVNLYNKDGLPALPFVTDEE